MTILRDDFEARNRFVDDRWQEFLTAHLQEKGILTGHLPDRIVGPDLYIWIGSFTDPETDRGGALATALRYDGRTNPELTPDEAEYVVMNLLATARRIWRVSGDDRTPELPS